MSRVIRRSTPVRGGRFDGPFFESLVLMAAGLRDVGEGPQRITC
jgi:hypothetical protein